MLINFNMAPVHFNVFFQRKLTESRDMFGYLLFKYKIKVNLHNMVIMFTKIDTIIQLLNGFKSS